MHPRSRRVPVLRSSFAGFRFPPDVITPAVRWYLRYGLSHRDVEELLVERGITVYHVSVYRWVQRLLIRRDHARLPGICDRRAVDRNAVAVQPCEDLEGPAPRPFLAGRVASLR